MRAYSAWPGAVPQSRGSLWATCNMQSMILPKAIKLTTPLQIRGLRYCILPILPIHVKKSWRSFCQAVL